MLFSQAKGKKVVSSSTAAMVGKVSGFVVDGSTRAVVALELKKADAGSVLRWEDLTAFGTDAVMVPEASVIGDGGPDVQALSGKAHKVVGKRVLTVGGDELGKVTDVDFDVEGGTVTSLVLARGAKGGDVAGARLVGIGSYAIVVHEQP